jgi:hypothetical protein
MTLPDAQYGENQQYQEIQAGAAVPQAAGPSTATTSLFNQLTPISAPSAQPGTPVTDGAMYGPGQDPSALGLDNPLKQQAQQLGQSGILAVMIRVADSDTATPEFKQYVRALLAAR